MKVSKRAQHLMHHVLGEIGVSVEKRLADVRFRVGLGKDPIFRALSDFSSNRMMSPVLEHELIDNQLQRVLAMASSAIKHDDLEVIAFPLKGQGAFIHHDDGNTSIFVDEHLIAVGLILSRLFVPLLASIDQASSALTKGRSAVSESKFFDHIYYNSVASDIAFISANEETYSLLQIVFEPLVAPYLAILEIISQSEIANDEDSADHTFWRGFRSTTEGLEYRSELEIYYVRFLCVFLANAIGHEVGHLADGHLDPGRVASIRNLRHALYSERSPEIELEPLEEIDADFFAVDYISELNRMFGWPQGELVDVQATNSFSGLLFFLDAAGWWATVGRPPSDFEAWLCNALLWDDFPVLTRFVEGYPTCMERFSHMHIKMLEVHSSGVRSEHERIKGSALYVIWNLIVTLTIEEYPLGWSAIAGRVKLNPGRQILLPESSLVLRREAFERAPAAVKASAMEAFNRFDPESAYSSRAFHDKFSSVAKYHARLQRDI